MDRMDRWGRVLWWWLRIGGQVSVGCPVRVAGRGPEGVWLWLAAGSPGWRARLPGGRRAHLRDLEPERWPPGGFPLRPDRWRNGSALILQPPGAGYAVWWFFARDGTLGGWYVNFERRTRYDEESLAASTGHPRFGTAEQAETVRAGGLRAGMTTPPPPNPPPADRRRRNGRAGSCRCAPAANCTHGRLEATDPAPCSL
ncbi:DUF402 domain-containing protein [Streptomyces albidoflavus]